MEREIKFRAWDGFKMYEPCVWMGKEYQPGRDSFIETHLMQFTGLKDKNGKEIYEGDIVSDGFEKAIITWFKDECQFLAFNKHELSGFNDPQVLGEWAEVIGNIYENPELLNN